MSDIDATVGAYGAAWLEKDEAARRRLLEQAWSEDGVYQDPTAEVSGRDALVRHIAGFHARFPDNRIVLTSGVVHHRGKIHFTWRMVNRDGATVSQGRDFGELADDGRIRRIIGFFGDPPALAVA